jgi:peptidoglycan hydrolase CwlO-like protein
MTSEMIVQLIIALLGTGGLIALYMVAEKKASAQLDNADKIYEQWQKVITQKEKDYETLMAKYEEVSSKRDKLFEDYSEIRSELDNTHTDCAVSKIMRCDCIACANRKPPMGTESSISKNASEEL